MDLQTAFVRAKRALREDAKLHVVSISSLTVAFLCLATALLALTNLSRLAEHWGSSGRMTIYLRDGARDGDIGQLRVAVEGLREVRAVEQLTSAQAREQFLRDSEVDTDLAALPPDVFPASLEVSLAAGTRPERVVELTERIKRFAAVEDVEAYRTFFDRLDALLVAGRGAALVLALLVVVCVLAVVGNTIRLAVAGRREEIEVLKLCGATDGFVRGPFLVEGGLQGLVASALAVVLLLAAFLALQGRLDGTLSPFTGLRSSFLPPLVALSLVLGGALVGVLGSAMSLRRYLAI